MKDVADPVLIENGDSRGFLAWEFAHLEVIIDLAPGHFIRRKRHVVVVVEVVSTRRDPIEAPAHAPLECLDLG